MGELVVVSMLGRYVWISYQKLGSFALLKGNIVNSFILNIKELLTAISGIVRMSNFTKFEILPGDFAHPHNPRNRRQTQGDHSTFKGRLIMRFFFCTKHDE